MVITAPTASAGSGSARERLRPVRWSARVSLGVAAAAVVVAVVAPSVLQDHEVAVLVAGFLLGLPHGAVDHLVPFWTGWMRRSLGGMLVVLVAYLGVAVLTWVGLRYAGPVVLPALLVASVLHFGAGDLMADQDEQAGDAALSSRLALVAAVVARGGPVVAGPLLVWPQRASEALASVDLSFEPPAVGVRVALAAVVSGCVVASAVRTWSTGRGTAVELGVLCGLFVVVPPLAAFGIYFGAWHGLRHTGRLLVRDPRNDADLEAGRWLRPLRRFLRAAALPSVVAAGTVGALVALAGERADLTGTLFTVLLALTVPHLVVVAALDLSGLRRPGRVSGPHHRPLVRGGG